MTEPIGQAVELYFDADSEARLSRQWDRIGSALTSLGARPHVSFAVFRPPTDAAPVFEAINNLASEIPCLEITLESVGIFPGYPAVVFLAPAASSPLVAAHERFHGLLGDVHRSALYLPGRWVPHCTMAMDLSSEEVGDAAAALTEGDAFGPARLTSIGLVDYFPVRLLHERPLTT